MAPRFGSLVGLLGFAGSLTLVGLVAAGASMLGLGIAAGVGDQALGPHGARVYIDAYHSARHPPDRRNLRHHHAWHTVSGTHRWVEQMRRLGLEVHVENERGFDAEVLADYDVVVLGEQSYEAKFLTPRERDELLAWVEGGGGLLAFGAPSDVGASADAFDLLFDGLHVRTQPPDPGRARVSDEPRKTPGPRRASLADPNQVHPVTAGVNEHLVRVGAGLETEHGLAFAAPEVDVGGATPATIAVLEHGDGRIVVFSDIDAFTNPMLHFGDHARLSRNALSWLAPAHRDPRVYWIIPGVLLLIFAAIPLIQCPHGQRSRAGIAGAGIGFAMAWLWIRGLDPTAASGPDVLVHAGNGSTMDLTSEAPRGYYTLYGHWGKDPGIRVWASRERLESGHDALVLAAPTQAYSPDQLSVIDGTLARGGTVVYLASLASLRSEAGRQLAEHFDYSVEIGEPSLRGREPYLAHGRRDLLDGVFRVFASEAAPPVRVTDGLAPLVHLTHGGSHVDDGMWIHRSCVYDLVSEKRARGLGRFVLVAPIEVFDNRNLGGLYRVGDEIVQQMTDLAIRVLQISAGEPAFPQPRTG